MPVSAESIVQAALREWERWGRHDWDLRSNAQTPGHSDDEIPFAALILEEYCPACNAAPTLLEIRDKKFAWSAAFISAVLRNAGFSRAEFPFSALHADYLHHFIQARRQGDTRVAFWGFRIDEPEATPAPGDLVAFARGEGVTPEIARSWYDKTPPYFSHTDIVTAKHGDTLEVVGGNVHRAVTRKMLSLSPTGHFAGKGHHWFVVLKRR